MSHLKHPILGDPVYGNNNSVRKGLDPELRHLITNFHRQALHAYALQLTHPLTKEIMAFNADLPTDLCALIDTLNTYDL